MTDLTDVQASSATQFIQSIGVNAHIDSWTSEWTNAQLILNEMSYLDISNIRDGTPYAWTMPVYVALAEAGIKFDLEQVNPVAGPMTSVDAETDVQRADSLEEAVSGSVAAMEGANEYNINSYDLGDTNSYGNLAWGALDDAQLQAAVSSDPLLAGVPVIAASTGVVDSAPLVSQYVDASNWHVYAGVGEQLASAMSSGIAAALATAPSMPVYITETGISSSGYGSSFWGVTDEVTQGIIDTNAVLDGYNDGASKTYIYELMDGTGLTAQDDDFGLFTSTGAPKPAAVDISNLTHILSDSDTTPFQAGTLAYALTGLPGTASSMLLEKSNGDFDIVIWNGEATLDTGGSDVMPPVSDVNVSLQNNQNSIDVYDPIQAVTPTQSYSGVSSVTVALSADPMIIEVAPSQISALALDKTLVTACYCAGTLIRTSHGEVPVERLAIGDRLVTLSGGLRRVRWIGHRRLDLTRHPTPDRVQPVRIRADAFADGVPQRDLLVSPDHAVLRDGALIPARLLVNDASIVRDIDCYAVTYYHVELYTHDILLAENLPAESYLDTGNRSMFENGGEPLLLHPDLTNDQARRVAESCMPFADDPERVENVWRALAMRAVQLGWRLPPEPETTDDPALCLLVAGRPVAPFRVQEGRYEFVLPSVDAVPWLMSRSVVVGKVRPWISDDRRLGVMLRGLTVRSGASVWPIPLDHPAFAEGWWQPEWHGRTVLCRWTDGNARVPMPDAYLMEPGPCVLEIKIAATPSYILPAPDGVRGDAYGIQQTSRHLPGSGVMDSTAYPHRTAGVRRGTVCRML